MFFGFQSDELQTFICVDYNTDSGKNQVKNIFKECFYYGRTKNYVDYKPQVQPYTIPKVGTIKETAAEFGISECTIRKWIKNGQLPVIKCGHSFLVNFSIFSRFLEGELQPVTVEPPQKPVAIGASGELYSADTKHKGKIKPIF